MILFLVGCNNDTESTIEVIAKYEIEIGDAAFSVTYKVNDYRILETNGWGGRKPTFITFRPINRDGTLGNKLKIPIHNLHIIETL